MDPASEDRPGSGSDLNIFLPLKTSNLNSSCLVMSFLITYHVLLFITGKDNLFPIPEDLDLRLIKFRIECGFGSFKKISWI